MLRVWPLPKENRLTKMVLRLKAWEKRRLKKSNMGFSGGLVVGYEKESEMENIYYLSDDVHSVTIGATRSGKSRCIVLQSIAYTALSGESMIVNDPKGELAAYTMSYLKRLGYEVICLDFKSPLKSSRYNFLQPVIDAVNRGDNAKAVDLVWDITSSLVGESKGERIWTDGEASIIAGAIMSVVFDNKDKPELQNFTNVYHFVLNMCKSEGEDMLINKYVKDIPDSHPAKGLFGIAQIAPSRTRGSFFTAALTTLRLFTNENIYSQTNASDFVLSETGDKKRVIFIVLPDEKTTFYSLASLFVYQHYVALVENADNRGGRLKNRVNFLLDEIGNFTVIPAFSNMLTVGGGRGIRFNLFLQSFAQIEEKYGKEQAETIKDNCHCWIYLKTANIETATQIAKKIGQYTTSSYGRSSSYNSSGGHNANVSNSMNLIARSLLTEDEIMRIERPYVLVMYSGYYPAMMKLPDLSEWGFNIALGLGDKEHNRLVREMYENTRIARKPQEIQLWGIWKQYAKSEDKAPRIPPVIEHGGMTDEGYEMLPESEAYTPYPRPVISRVKSVAEMQRDGENVKQAFDMFGKTHGLRSAASNRSHEENMIERIEVL